MLISKEENQQDTLRKHPMLVHSWTEQFSQVDFIIKSKEIAGISGEKHN